MHIHYFNMILKCSPKLNVYVKNPIMIRDYLGEAEKQSNAAAELKSIVNGLFQFLTTWWTITIQRGVGRTAHWLEKPK